MAKMIRNRIGELKAIKERGDGQRLTYRKMGEDLDVSKTTIQLWVSNNVQNYSADLLLKFMEYFGVSDMNDILVVEETT